MTVIGFVVLAAAGTLLRTLASSPVAGFDRHLWTTFGLNMVGSFALGWLHGSDADSLVVIGVGGLGSLTTFSTFIWQLECIARRGGTLRNAVLFGMLSITAGVAAAAIGFSL